MSKLPPRRILRSIVMDAISDREGFNDPSIADETAATIRGHKALLERLSDNAPPLDEEAKDSLALACLHARIWRESYVDSWLSTGEKNIILRARQDVHKIDRVEKALGFRYRMQADVEMANAKTISLADIPLETAQ